MVERRRYRRSHTVLVTTVEEGRQGDTVQSHDARRDTETDPFRNCPKEGRIRHACASTGRVSPSALDFVYALHHGPPSYKLGTTGKLVKDIFETMFFN